MKKETNLEALSVIQMPISHPQKEVFAYMRDDRALKDAACRYSEKLQDNGVEVFERRGNVIATDKGYFAVLFDEEIRQQPGGIDNPIPFKGSDGRFKIRLIKENGDSEIKDLAELVAMQFVPNLHLRKKIWFKDGNMENVNADNLKYVPTWAYWYYKLFKRKL